jgi:hypothetical protein
LPAIWAIIIANSLPIRGLAATQIEQQDVLTGPCAAVIGQNNGSVTLNCSGVEPGKVQQILGILNHLVERQNNLTVLTAKIDEGLAALKMMNDRDSKDKEDQEKALIDSMANADRRCASRVAKTSDEIRGFIATPVDTTTGQFVVPTVDFSPVYDAMGGIAGLQNQGIKRLADADVETFNDSWAALQHANIGFASASGALNAHIIMARTVHVGANQHAQQLDIATDRRSLTATLEVLTTKYNLLCNIIHKLHGEL